MDDHIRTFTRLQTMADYHRPATNPPMNKEDINLISVKENSRECKLKLDNN